MPLLAPEHDERAGHSHDLDHMPLRYQVRAKMVGGLSGPPKNRC